MNHLPIQAFKQNKNFYCSYLYGKLLKLDGCRRDDAEVVLQGGYGVPVRVGLQQPVKILLWQSRIVLLEINADHKVLAGRGQQLLPLQRHQQPDVLVVVTQDQIDWNGNRGRGNGKRRIKYKTEEI